MKMLRRARAIASIAVGFVAVALVCTAAAESYPTKPVRVLIATSAGANPDTVMRIVANGLTKQWGQQVVVDNRAGAGGNIGADIAARAATDGYTIFLAHTNHSINASLYRKLSYDIVKDFSPVSLLALSPFVAAVHPSLPVKSLQGLISLAKTRPGDLIYASAGTGSGTFFSAEYFNGMAKIKMLHVPYKGGGPALASAVSGETAVYFAPIGPGMPHIKSGKLRPLGVSSSKRLALLPQVPAIAETLPGYEMLSWAGLMVPAGTPQPIIEAIHTAAATVTRSPEVNKRLTELGYIVVGSRPEELASYVNAEIAKYAKIIREIGLPLQ